MSTVDVIKSFHDSLHQISEQIEGAVVYLDAGCTESFQFLGAFRLLLEHGARTVCSLEDMSSLDTIVDWNASSEQAKKIVVMTSCLLSDTHRYILRCLSTLQSVCHCSIFTSIPETAHSAYPDSPLGPDAYREYESLLIQDYEELANKYKTNSGQSEGQNVQGNLNAEDEGWSQLGQKNASPSAATSDAGNIYEDNAVDPEQKLKVSVHHFPMIFCPLSPKVFVLPSGGSIADACLSTEHEDSLCPGLPPMSTGAASDNEDAVPGATLTAHFLYHLAAKMDLKLEIFSFGDQSKSIGRILTDMSSLYDVGRRKRSAGLILIDRTLDLLTPCCHADSFFDQIFSSLPRSERSTPSTLMKNSATPGKSGSTHLHRAPLDAQIPLENILVNEDFGSDSFQLLENIEAILRGWNSSSADSKIQDLITLSSKLRDENSLCSKGLLNGFFVASESFRGTPYMEAILDRGVKDGSVLVKKWLQEALRKENITVNIKSRPGSATKSELEPMIKALAKRDSSLLRNKGIIQLATAALVALDESNYAKWDAFISAEKMLRVCAADTSQNLAAQISDLINKTILAASQGGKSRSSEGLISFKDALLLTMIGYILAGENFPTSGSSGPFSWQEEHSLKEAIVDAVFESPEAARFKPFHGLIDELVAFKSKITSEETKEQPENELSIDDFDDDEWGKWGDEDTDDNSSKEQAYNDMQLKLELRDRVDSLFRFFHKLSSLKMRNVPLRGSEVGINTDSYERKGLLYRLLTRVLSKYDVPGLEHHSSAVGRIFKSGLGRFGLGQSKPSLADQNVILVFVVGGTNGMEVREANEALSESGRPDIELIVGGTTLLTPYNMLELLLGNSSFFKS